MDQEEDNNFPFGILENKSIQNASICQEEENDLPIGGNLSCIDKESHDAIEETVVVGSYDEALGGVHDENTPHASETGVPAVGIDNLTDSVPVSVAVESLGSTSLLQANSTSSLESRKPKKAKKPLQQNKDGTFKKPAGRMPKNSEWDAVNGQWKKTS